MTTIDEAATALAVAKHNENQARTARVAAEEALLAMLETRDEGTVSARGVAWKVTARYGINRTVDAAALEAVRAAVPREMFEQVIEYKPAIKLPGLRYMRNNEPQTYAVLAQAITAKPAKPSVSIEAIEVQAQAA